MPPVFFLALLAAGIAGYRIWSSLADRSGSHGSQRGDTERVRRAAAPVRDLGNLEWDERAGVYRPPTKREN